MVTRAPVSVAVLLRAVGLLPAAVLLLTAGCYTFQEVERIEAVSPEAEVRAILTLTGRHAVELQRNRGVGESLRGRMLGTEGDTLYLALHPVSSGRPGSPASVGVERVAVPRDGLVRVEQKELDGRRTAVTLGGAAIAVALFVAWRFAVAGGTGPTPGEPFPPGDTFRP